MLEQANPLHRYEFEKNGPYSETIQTESVESIRSYAPEVIPATVLAIEVRDFNALLEAHSPAQIVMQLNQSLTRITNVIEELGGVICQSHGDRLLIYFTDKTPDNHTKAATSALWAAQKVLSTMALLNRDWGQKQWPAFKLGIGIHTGPVLVGQIGSLGQKQRTVVGETLNIAIRLQQLTHDLKTTILISGKTQGWVTQYASTRPMGQIPVKNKESIVIYLIEGIQPNVEPVRKREWASSRAAV